MPLEIPTIASESTTIAAELAGEVGDSIPQKSALKVLSNAVAGAVVTLYRYFGRRWLDMFARHASTEVTTVLGRSFIPLVELGNMLGVGDPLPGYRARLQVLLQVTEAGNELPAGSILVGAINGVTYVTEAAVSLDDLNEVATIVAVEDQNGTRGYGEIGNLANGSVVTFSAPVRGVYRNAVVVGTLTSGSEAEQWPAYRNRVHNARRNPPQGGAYTDYRAWAEVLPGIEAVFPYTGAPGIVDVYVRATPASSGSADGIPTAGQLAQVLSYIEGTVGTLATKRPVNAGVRTLAITRKTFDIQVNGLTITNIDAADAAIIAACDEHLRTREPFIVGFSELPRRDRITNAELSGVVSQVVAALGGSVTSVSLTSASEDVTAYGLTFGEHAKLGSVTYTV